MAFFYVVLVIYGGMFFYGRRFKAACAGESYQNLIGNGLLMFAFPLLGGLAILFFSDELIRAMMENANSGRLVTNDEKALSSYMALFVKIMGFLSLALGGLGLLGLQLFPKEPPFVKKRM